MASSDTESDRSSSRPNKTVVDLRFDLPDAIERGSIEDVEKLLQYDGAVDIRFTYHFQQRKDESSGATSLILAAALGKDNIVQLLLDHGASIDDMTQENGSTAMHLAAEHAQVKVVNVLLENGALVDDLNDFNYTPLIYACWAGHFETVKFLVNKGADPTHIDHTGWNSLGWACRYGHPDIVRFLLGLETEVGSVGSASRKKFLNLQDNDNWSSITRAICNDHFNCVRALLSEPDIDVTIIDDDGDTPLSTAARKNVVFIMVQILGMEVYFPNNPVTCESRIASPFEFSYIEKALLNGIEQATRKPQEQDRVTFWAVANGSLQLVQKCLERQPNVIEWSRAGATWLHVAAKYGRHELIKLFVARGLNPCVAADRRTTPLHLAAAGGHRIAVRCILESLQGVTNSPSYKSKSQAAGRSPLPGLELIQFIMEENDDGESPITLSGKAKSRGASDILWGEIETFAMTTPNFVEFLPMKPDRLSELAAQFERPGDERILKLLLQQTNKKGLGWNSKHWTALHWAVDSSRAVLVWWLLSNGAHLRSEEIQSALQIVKDKSNNGYGISEVDLLIADLLQNPPMISAHAVNEDDYHLPELPTLPDNHREFLEHEGIIVDFYCQDESTDFQYKRRSLREIVYERGPNAIMASTGRYNCNDLDGLKQQLELTRQAPAYPSVVIPRRTTSETVPGPSESERRKPRAGRESSKGMPAAKMSEGDNLGGDLANIQESRDFRWVHVPAHNTKVAEDLITRIVIDSGKTKRQHGPLVDLLKQSLVEVAAGGGKRYIKPQFIRRTIDDTGPDGEERPSNDNTSSSGDESSDTDNDNNNENNESGDESSESSSDPFADESAALYMPFLTVAEIMESAGGHREKGAQRPTVVSRTMQPQGTDEKDPSKTLHERMTLDQYYYTTLPDSTYRDYDQVLSRYLAWQESEYGNSLPSETVGQKGLPVKVFSVDQLWLWIIDDATIVTASTCDFEGFVDTVFDALVFGKAKGEFPRPSSVRPMMEFILGIVTGPHMRNVPLRGKKKTKQPLEIFRESIRHVADIETKMSRDFIDSVVGGYCAVLPKRSVGKEYRLLYEIKDIRDELTILKALAEAQDSVWRQAFRTGLSADGSEFEYRHLQSPRRSLLEIKEMAREAESVQDAINTLLDLRQKHAGNQDAEFGRQQANTTMVFTIVTIIFLPLSFLASLFALDVAEFPHDSGDVKYKASWVFPIIFGCALAVSVPLIIIAFNVNELIMIPYNRSRVSKSNRQPGLSSVRPLTEETVDSSTSISSASMEPLLKRNRATDGRLSRKSPRYPGHSLYGRVLRKPRHSYRQKDDCEAGENRMDSL